MQSLEVSGAVRPLYGSLGVKGWILCSRTSIPEKKYITIHRDSGELRTGDDPVDYEEYDELTYTVVATDGTWETRMNVSRISFSLECNWILLVY